PPPPHPPPFPYTTLFRSPTRQSPVVISPPRKLVSVTKVVTWRVMVTLRSCPSVNLLRLLNAGNEPSELALVLRVDGNRGGLEFLDRKSTRLNSSHVKISY